MDDHDDEHNSDDSSSTSYNDDDVYYRDTYVQKPTTSDDDDELQYRSGEEEEEDEYLRISENDMRDLVYDALHDCEKTTPRTFENVRDAIEMFTNMKFKDMEELREELSHVGERIDDDDDGYLNIDEDIYYNPLRDLLWASTL